MGIVAGESGVTPKNWKTFQHYSDRKPAWIKLHRALLDDYTFACLPLASQALAPRLWLLASEYSDGKITASLDEMAFRLHCSVSELRIALKPLVNAEFFIDDSGLLAECKQDAMPEKERETQVQTEIEETSSRSLRSRTHDVTRETSDWPKDYRAQFWSAYPRRKAKGAAFKALDRIKREGIPFGQIMAGIEKIPKNEPQFIPHPATWLNQCRWEDEVLPGENNGSRGPRALQDDRLSVGQAAERLRVEAGQGTISFPPRPRLLPEKREDDLRLLPPGRSA